jgi:hypothetical protein
MSPGQLEIGGFTVQAREIPHRGGGTLGYRSVTGPGQAGRRWTRLVADTTVRSVKKFAPAAGFLSYRASASRTRWTIISSSAQAVSGCSNAKGRKTHAVNSRQRNSVSAVIVAER